MPAPVSSSLICANPDSSRPGSSCARFCPAIRPYLKPRFANYPACRHGGLPVLFKISGAAVSQPFTIRAGLPAGLLPAFRAALEAQREIGFTSESAHTVRLSRTVIERVLTACEDTNAGELNPLLAVLRRFETEALREEARVLAFDLRRPEQEETGIVLPMASTALAPRGPSLSTSTRSKRKFCKRLKSVPAAIERWRGAA